MIADGASEDIGELELGVAFETACVACAPGAVEVARVAAGGDDRCGRPGLENPTRGDILRRKPRSAYLPQSPLVSNACR
jgi:hypothetical protein